MFPLNLVLPVQSKTSLNRTVPNRTGFSLIEHRGSPVARQQGCLGYNHCYRMNIHTGVWTFCFVFWIFSYRDTPKTPFFFSFMQNFDMRTYTLGMTRAYYQLNIINSWGSLCIVVLVLMMWQNFLHLYLNVDPFPSLCGTACCGWKQSKLLFVTVTVPNLLFQW